MTGQRHDHDDVGHEGLAKDLERLDGLTRRRRALQWFAGLALLPVLGCADTASDSTGSGGAGGAGGSTGSSGTCEVIPEETGGPYPGDGTNGPNVLTESGIVRSDIRSSFGDMSGTAAGVPLTIELTIVTASTSCAAAAGYAVYLWHCDIDGHYSLYTAANQNYLRGVQETDDDGVVTFTSIFPACYSGRWPHIHFEVYESLSGATSATGKVKTSQIAMVESTCDDVFATTGYSASVGNLAQVSLDSDMVFADGAALETPTMTGDATTGYTLKLTVAV